MYATCKILIINFVYAQHIRVTRLFAIKNFNGRKKGEVIVNWFHFDPEPRQRLQTFSHTTYQLMLFYRNLIAIDNRNFADTSKCK